MNSITRLLSFQMKKSANKGPLTEDDLERNMTSSQKEVNLIMRQSENCTFVYCLASSIPKNTIC